MIDFCVNANSKQPVLFLYTITRGIQVILQYNVEYKSELPCFFHAILMLMLLHAADGVNTPFAVS